jgi:hypothetical protein
MNINIFTTLDILGEVMISATFVIDESGAKGYSGNREKDIGELGVIAGFIVPNAQFEKVESEITAITKNYLINGKLHITDLKPSEQESLRDSIFAYFISVKEGLHNSRF